MNRFLWLTVVFVAVTEAAGPSLLAQTPRPSRRTPHLGYCYPAGGQQGTTHEVTVGGQYLSAVSSVHVTGIGVQATVLKYDRPLNPNEANRLRNKLQQVREQMQSEGKVAPARGRPGRNYREFLEYARKAGVTDEDFRRLNEFRTLRTDPKRQLNPQIAETVRLKLQIAADAELGEHELRLLTPSQLSNPIRFHVGFLPERRETEPNDHTADSSAASELPVVLNGQILPGDVDRFRFQARKGQHLVVAASARKLIPYLADAVPGWFQATVALFDAQGNEVAFSDDFRFDPDPVVAYDVPADGAYVLEIRDAIYRGREDFVYRVVVGELPFVTSVFPLGAPEGSHAAVTVRGWNLPIHSVNLDTPSRRPDLHLIPLPVSDSAINRVSFAIGTLPERFEVEPNHSTLSDAQRIELPTIINGRIDQPDDTDVFRFEGRAGQTIVAEVTARRLNSPVDSLLALTDAGGKILAVNDDHRDQGAGLTTHHADSWLSAELPEDGTYLVRVADTQQQGGPECAYRLRISPPQPGFQLRVVPSSITARPGSSVPITVYALRQDGFDGDITLELKDAPVGFDLSGAWIPAHHDRITLTITVPPRAEENLARLRLEGRAMIEGDEVRREAVPADDMMQAFIYHHLVPAQQWRVNVAGRGRVAPQVRLLAQHPIKLPTTGTAEVRVLAPGSSRVSDVQWELNDPPEGITLDDVWRGRLGLTMVLRADAAKVQPGLKGNLIVDAFVERTLGPNAGPQKGSKRRFPVGTLPAIAFEVVKSE